MLDRYNNKFYKLLIKITSIPIYNSSLRQTFRYALRYGKEKEIWNEYRRITKNKLSQYPYYLTLTACLKNEADYVAEWIEYNLLMGVEHFFLYDNESDDNIKEVLAPYIEQGLVTYTFFPGKLAQYDIYNHSIRTNRFSSKWMIIVDIDEFLVTHTADTVREQLKKYENFDQVQYKWYEFGDSGHKTKPDGLVTENFTFRGDKFYIERKSVFQPAKAYFLRNPHEATVVGKTIMLPFEEGQCNHYFTKSEEEYFTKKAPRGDISTLSDTYTAQTFQYRNTNIVEDTSILKFVEPIKKALAARKLS